MLRWLLTICLLVSSAAASPKLNIAGPTSGMASWYGAREQGKRMANGRRFDRNKYTCASKVYPLGTILRVTHNSSTVYVRVTDRGPWVRGRVLDLSERSATILGIKATGIGYVEIEPVRLWRNNGNH